MSKQIRIAPHKLAFVYFIVTLTANIYETFFDMDKNISSNVDIFIDTKVILNDFDIFSVA